MTSTGKAARRSGGNRYACKRNRQRSRNRKTFGSLPWSHQEGKGNAAHFRPAVVANCQCANGCPGVRGGDHRPQAYRRPQSDRMSFAMPGAA